MSRKQTLSILAIVVLITPGMQFAGKPDRS